MSHNKKYYEEIKEDINELDKYEKELKGTKRNLLKN